MFERCAASNESRRRTPSSVVRDGDVIVVRSVEGETTSLWEAFEGEGWRAVAGDGARVRCVRIETRRRGGATNGRGAVRVAFRSIDDDVSRGGGKWASVRGDRRMKAIGFESAAVTKEAHWDVTSCAPDASGRGTRVRLRARAARGVKMEIVMRHRACAAIEAFERWGEYERAIEGGLAYHVELNGECETLLNELSDGFMKELTALESEIIKAGKVNFGKRVVSDEKEPDSPAVNPFEVASPAPAPPPAAHLDPLPLLNKRSTEVNPSTPAGAIRTRRNKVTFTDEYPSPTDEEIAVVRDESWRFASTGKKSARPINPFGSETPATAEKTPEMSDYWDFAPSDDEYHDAQSSGSLTPQLSRGATEVRRSITTTTTTPTEQTVKVLFEGKYNRIETEDFEVAAIRKSGIDPRDVVSTPGTTSAMLKYVGQMYVSEFRSEMNILNVPYVTLDEVIVDFVELAARKRREEAIKDPRLNIKEALTEQYILSMKTDDFLVLLHNYGDEPGYAEVSTLKRALAIAITTKGALSSSSEDERYY